MRLPTLTKSVELSKAAAPVSGDGIVAQIGCKEACGLGYIACKAAGLPLCDLAYQACLALC